MNGTDRDRPDYGGRTVYENAERTAQDVLERAVRHNGLRELNPEWEVRAEVYEKKVGRVESYMTDMNGPTAYVCFVFDADGDLDYAYLHYSSSNDDAVVRFGQFDSEDLYKQFRDYR